MKRLTNICAAAALALMSAPLAMAQPAPNHDATHMMQPGHGEPSNMPMPHQATPMAHMQGPQHMAPMTSGHGMAANMPMPHQATPPQHMAYSGHTWRHGDHYDGGRHTVSNWQYYHLRQPPAGYEWVQDGSQFVLIAVASGIVADVILNAMNN